MALRRSEERLHIGHHRLKILTLVEEHAVPVGDLVLPVLLPLAQSRLFEQAVCLNDDLRSSGLEAYPSLDTDDRVTHIAVAADGIACTDLLNLLNGFHLVIEMLAIDSLDLTFLESDTQLRLRLFCCDMFQISALRQTLGRIEKFTAADTRAPDTYIVTIFEFREVGKEPVGIEIVDLLLTRQFLVTGERDDLHLRCHDLKGHIETNLIIAGTCRAVGDSVSLDLIGVTRNGDGLEDTL